MNVRTLLFTTVAGLVVSGCSRYEAFRPSQEATAASLEGFPAAEYEPQAADRALGEVKVWSMGAKKVRYGGEPRTLLHTGLEVRNTSNQTIIIDPAQLRLEAVVLDDESLENIEVSNFEGPARIAAGDAETIDVFFAMPDGIDPDDLDAFRLKWALVGETDERGKRAIYTEWTPFIENDMMASGAPGYGYGYGPYGWYAPYGYGPYGTYPYGTYPYMYSYPYVY